MPRQTTIAKKAYCKRAVFMEGGQRPTLQQQVSGALARLRTIGDRREEWTVADGSPAQVRAVLHHRADDQTAPGMLFGILAGYERGTHQLTVAEDDAADMLTIEQVAPPLGSGDRRREFLDGACWFGLFDNHVVLVASRALGVKAVEQHLNWLLRRAGTLAPGDRVALSDQVAQATRERICTQHVKEVQIGAPLVESHDPSVATVVRGLGLDILRQVLGAQALEQLRLADAVDGNLEVTLRVRYRRATHDRARQLLDNIALAVRNLDDDEVRLTLEGGGIVNGADLKLTQMLRVPGRDGVPDADALFQRLHGWLRELIEHRIVEPS